MKMHAFKLKLLSCHFLRAFSRTFILRNLEHAQSTRMRRWSVTLAAQVPASGSRQPQQNCGTGVASHPSILAHILQAAIRLHSVAATPGKCYVGVEIHWCPSSIRYHAYKCQSR